MNRIWERGHLSLWWRVVVVVGVAIAGLFWVSSSASAVTVGDEAGLRAAVSDVSETSITLSANIVLTCGGGGARPQQPDTPDDFWWRSPHHGVMRR